VTGGGSWSAAQAIFLDALDQPTEGREAWIHAACGGDLALLGEVQAFLRAHGEEGLVGEWVGASGRPALPDRVGAYRIIRPIGEGGCIGDDLNGQWLAPPAFQSLYLGWERYQAAGNDRNLWVDDVVVSAERVGCPE
jgi:hypothetical protein